MLDVSSLQHSRTQQRTREVPFGQFGASGCQPRSKGHACSCACLCNCAKVCALSHAAASLDGAHICVFAFESRLRRIPSGSELAITPAVEAATVTTAPRVEETSSDGAATGNDAFNEKAPVRSARLGVDGCYCPRE